jgi:toxin ParE1/3/4
MVRVRWSAKADRDLDRIEAFLATVDLQLAVAAAMVIRDRVRLVLENPAIGSPLPGGQRKIVERRFGYVIFYRHNRDGITILRIRHAREDWG